MGTKAIKLKNGLQVIIDSKPYFESIGVAFGVRFGSVYEKPEQAGVAHFIEHMLFKGTKNRSWIDIEKELRKITVSHNAETDFESTVFHLKIDKNNFENAIEFLSDLVKNPAFPEEQIERERGPIINENLISKDTPWSVAGEELLKVMLKNHPAGRPIIGFEKTIRRIDRKILIENYKKFYTPQNSVLTVYGGVKSSDGIKCIRKYFNEFEGKMPDTKIKPVDDTAVGRSIKLYRPELKEGIFLMGLKTPPVSRTYESLNKDEVTPLVACKLLSNRLYDFVRGKLGLAYEVNASIYQYKMFSLMFVNAGAMPNEIDKVKAAIFEEIRMMHALSEREADIESVKQSMIADFKLMQEDSISSAIRAAHVYLVRRIHDASGYENALKAVKFNDLKRFLKKYLDVKRCTTIEMLPK